MDGLKFDLRIYVLVTGMDPLRIFLFEDGLTRLATEPYKEIDEDNIKDMCMHLTNYAINKHSDQFVQNEDANQDSVGHKRSLKYALKYIS
jgi:tubulin polyglutamylase TTLL6/13